MEEYYGHLCDRLQVHYSFTKPSVTIRIMQSCNNRLEIFHQAIPNGHPTLLNRNPSFETTIYMSTVHFAKQMKLAIVKSFLIYRTAEPFRKPRFNFPTLRANTLTNTFFVQRFWFRLFFFRFNINIKYKFKILKF